MHRLHSVHHVIVTLPHYERYEHQFDHIMCCGILLSHGFATTTTTTTTTTVSSHTFKSQKVKLASLVFRNWPYWRSAPSWGERGAGRLHAERGGRGGGYTSPAPGDDNDVCIYIYIYI